MKFEVFERLNTGGLALNAQEVRNAIYRGTLNETLKELERGSGFRHCLGSKTPRRRMVDRELVLRFLALSDRLDAYRPPLLRFLNDYMLDNRDAKARWLTERAERFQETTALVADVLGQSAFRVIDGKGTPLERNINRAVFDAQMLVFSVADANAARMRRAKVIRGFGGLFEDADFLDAIRRATGDRARTHERVRNVAAMLEEAGVAVDLASLGKL